LLGSIAGFVPVGLDVAGDVVVGGVSPRFATLRSPSWPSAAARVTVPRRLVEEEELDHDFGLEDNLALVAEHLAAGEFLDHFDQPRHLVLEVLAKVPDAVLLAELEHRRLGDSPAAAHDDQAEASTMYGLASYGPLPKYSSAPA
jgi:hypothetical protein